MAFRRRSPGTARRRIPGRVSLLVAVGAATLSVGLSIGVAIAPASTPADIARATGTGTVPVSSQQFPDGRQLSLAVAPGAQRTLAFPREGRVTAMTCVAGGELASGSSAVSVNDEALILLATGQPLWRDLSVGDKGPDVSALQAELARLGHDIVVDGTLGRGSLSAVRVLAKGLGHQSAEWQTVPADLFVWLPAPAVTAVSCDAQVGDQVTVGDPLATLTRAVASASVQGIPAEAVPGERVIAVDDATIPVDANGAVVAEESLRILADTPSYRSALGGGQGQAHGQGQQDAGGQDGAVTVSVEFRLAEPVATLVVPPAALYAIERDDACILSGGTPHAVRLIGSQLGKTFVQLAAPATVTRVDLGVRGAPACR
ncbi:peptidoglycan-binding domain-containing protein [Leifsonia sp. Le1]|uniref:peptidoglycan-binding domain-containing protein n=1 Tax=Leifsonia sp. Le1 TaxID=3404918 RepID=UPI003EBEC237